MTKRREILKAMRAATGSVAITDTSSPLNPPSCPSCNTSSPWISIVRPVEQETPSGPITIQTEVTECQNCGFRILTDPQLSPSPPQLSPCPQERGKLT